MSTEKFAENNRDIFQIVQLYFDFIFVALDIIIYTKLN